MSSIIKQLPTVALRGLTILPGMVAHFDVSREKSIKAVEEAMMDEQEIFLLTQKNPEEEEPTAENLYSIGLVAEIKQVIKMPNDLVRVLVEGIERAARCACVRSAGAQRSIGAGEQLAGDVVRVAQRPRAHLRLRQGRGSAIPRGDSL